MAGKQIKDKKTETIDGVVIKYHANGNTVWSKGKIIEGKPERYWEWFRIDGTLKRSGSFENGEPTGEWITYDAKANHLKPLKR